MGLTLGCRFYALTGFAVAGVVLEALSFYAAEADSTADRCCLIADFAPNWSGYDSTGWFPAVGVFFAPQSWAEPRSSVGIVASLFGWASGFCTAINWSLGPDALSRRCAGLSLGAVAVAFAFICDGYAFSGLCIAFRVEGYSCGDAACSFIAGWNLLIAGVVWSVFTGEFPAVGVLLALISSWANSRFAVGIIAGFLCRASGFGTAVNGGFGLNALAGDTGLSLGAVAVAFAFIGDGYAFSSLCIAF